MIESTEGVAPEALEAPDFSTLFTRAESPSLEELLAWRSRVWASDADRRRFARLAEELTTASFGTETERAYRVGGVLYLLGQWEKAAQQLHRCRNHPEAAALLAKSLVRLGRADEALPVAEGAVRERPTDPAVRAVLFEAVERSGDFEGLARLVRGAPKSFQGTADCEYFEGRVAEEEGRAEDAIAAYERALDRDADHRGALFRLAYNLDLRGMDEEATGVYERLARLKPVDAAALMNLGLLYEDRGDYEKAIPCFEAVLRAKPDHGRARLYLKDARAALTMQMDETLERQEDRLQQILAIPVADFELSVRARNCLQKMDIRTLADLVRKTEAELLAYKNFGETSLNEIKELLQAKGVRLGMLKAEAEAAAIREMEEEALAMEREQEGEGAGAGKGEAAEEAAGEEDSALHQEARAETLTRPVQELELSSRSRRALEALGVSTIGDLLRHRASDLLHRPNFGETSLREVREKLRALDLALPD